MAASPMVLIATARQDAAADEPVARVSEVPELASMALLSVVLAGVSVAVRRYGTRSARQRSGDAAATAEPDAAATPRARSSPSES